MLSDMFDGSTLPLLEQVVDFTQRRHGVLAGNIANLDTPGYLVRDISPTDFQARLKEAVAAQHAQENSARSAYSDYLPQQAPVERPDPFAQVKRDTRSILRHDGNNGGLEEQVTEIAKNQQQHNLALSLMNAQFRLLKAAVTERA